MIRVSHLSKTYGAQVALDDVSFEVGAGEVVGFLGPNGAGKSTALRILAGVLGPSSGTVSIAGHDVVEDSVKARRSIGYMPETVPLYPEMRVLEYLRFRAELKRGPRRLRAALVEDAMAKAGVIDVANRRIGLLSKGYRQRVGIADAIVARPPIVVLDEPTAGLDPNQIRQTRMLIRELGRSHTVVVSTHILGEVEACATRVLLLHRGKIVAQGPTHEIRAMRLAQAVEVSVRGNVPDALRILSDKAGIAHAERIHEGRTIDAGAGVETTEEPARVRATFLPGLSTAQQTQAIEQMVAGLVAAGLAVSEVETRRGSLEDVFAALTEDSPEQLP